MSRSGSPRELRRLNAATAHLDAPFAIVDLTAFRANAAAMMRRARGKPIRLASKSVRCRPLIEQVLQLDGFRGILAYTLPEALWLTACGTSDDIVVAYPTADRSALARLASDATAAASIAVMVDSIDHLELIEKVAAEQANPHPIRVAIDIDAGYVTLGGRFRAGARRSPVRTPGDAVELAQAIMARPGLRLVGLMAYEAQIAGVGDDPPGRPLYARGVAADAAPLGGRASRPQGGDRRRDPVAHSAGVRERRRDRLARGHFGRARHHRDRGRLGLCTTRRCSTPTGASPASQPRCSHCRSSAARDRAW